jgi:hypothetical protein
MLIRDWLSSKGTMVGQLNDASLEEGKSYVSNISSVSGSHIDVDILSAIDDLTQLNLIDQEKVKNEQEAKYALKQLWSESLD